MEELEETEDHIPMRTISNNINISTKSIEYLFLKRLAFDSKNLFNTALYFHRQHYYHRQMLITKIANNIESFHQDLSFDDICEIIKFHSKNNHFMNWLLNNLDSSDLRKLSAKILDKNNTFYDKFVKIKKNNKDKINPNSRHKTDQEVIQWIDLLPNIIQEVNTDFFNNMKLTFEHKISKKNPNKGKSLKTKKKNKKEKKEEDKKEKKKKEEDKKTTAKCNYIPKSFFGGIYSDIFARISNSTVYSNLPSQAAQEICHHKMGEAYRSFFEKKKKDPKSNPPTYLEKNGSYILVWKQGFSFKDDNNIFLSPLSSAKKVKNIMSEIIKNTNMADQYKPILGNKEYIVNGIKKKYKDILTFKSTSFVKNCDISTISIKKSHNHFKMLISYKLKPIETPTIPEKEMSRFLAIDLGVINLCGMVTNIKGLKPWIISGSSIVQINQKYSNLIDKAKSNTKKHCNKETSKYIKSLWEKRDNKLKYIFHIISKQIIDYCQNHDIHKLIIGYNINWKNKPKMSKESKKKFLQIPYKRLIKYLFDKAEKIGLAVVENEESYTSKCDALALETFNDCFDRKANYRTKRGLFESQSGFLINADINAALNILRKHINKSHKNIKDDIYKFIAKNRKQFLNPTRSNFSKLIKPGSRSRNRHPLGVLYVTPPEKKPTV